MSIICLQDMFESKSTNIEMCVVYNFVYIFLAIAFVKHKHIKFIQSYHFYSLGFFLLKTKQQQNKNVAAKTENSCRTDVQHWSH